MKSLCSSSSMRICWHGISSFAPGHHQMHLLGWSPRLIWLIRLQRLRQFLYSLDSIFELLTSRPRDLERLLVGTLRPTQPWKFWGVAACLRRPRKCWATRSRSRPCLELNLLWPHLSAEGTTTPCLPSPVLTACSQGNCLVWRPIGASRPRSPMGWRPFCSSSW